MGMTAEAFGDPMLIFVRVNRHHFDLKMTENCADS